MGKLTAATIRENRVQWKGKLRVTSNQTVERHRSVRCGTNVIFPWMPMQTAFDFFGFAFCQCTCVKAVRHGSTGC